MCAKHHALKEATDASCRTFAFWKLEPDTVLQIRAMEHRGDRSADAMKTGACAWAQSLTKVGKCISASVANSSGEAACALLPVARVQDPLPVKEIL